MSLVPFDNRDGWIWLDGQFVPWRDAKVHVLTHGLHYASTVFEGQRAYGGEVFELTRHSQRLIDSGRMLDFTIPYSVEEINEACRQVLAEAPVAPSRTTCEPWRRPWRAPTTPTSRCSVRHRTPGRSSSCSH